MVVIFLTVVDSLHRMEFGIMARPTPARVRTAARDIAEQFVSRRKLLGLTAEQLAERAGIARGTLRKLEQGDPGVSVEAFLI